ncbi:MAG: cytochrome c oxidase subunit II [Chloroflexi bacterium]|nr:cytochrome c oxidase subunit II [Chloroflexota bacterium]
MAVRSWRIPWRLVALASLTLLPLLWSGCYPDHPQSSFGVAGPLARDQRNLFLFIFWMAAFVFVVVEGALVFAVFRFRRRPGQMALPKQTHGNTPLEVTWTILPALVLVVIAVPTITTIFAQAEPPAGDRLEVRVVAHQWWWEFQYPQLGVTTANELHVPINRPATLLLNSDDVIHSFWVPKLTGKTDVIPTRNNTMWFEAEEEGTYYGQCAELCGLAHAQMKFQVIAQSQADFDLWVAGQKAPPAVATALAFNLKGCSVCHTVSGPDAEGLQEARMDAFRAWVAAGGQGPGRFPGPNLTHFASRDTFAAGLLVRSDENLRRWLRDPEAVKPGNRMKELATAYHGTSSQALTEQDIDDLVAYLQGLK